MTMPLAAGRDSATLERNTAATTVPLTVPPPSRLAPMTTDLGMPSSRAPRTVPVGLSPYCSASN